MSELMPVILSSQDSYARNLAEHGNQLAESRRVSTSNIRTKYQMNPYMSSYPMPGMGTCRVWVMGKYMEYRSIKGVQIPVIGFGTSGLVGRMEPDPALDKTGIEAIQYAISLRITHIDTAELYAQGHAEEVVGQAAADFPREKLFITTKVQPTHLAYDDVLIACKASLKRLNLDYVDLYLVHWPNPDIPLKETMPAMDELVKQGLTKFIGVSNFNVKLVKEAQKYSENPIITDQVKYNLVEREPETDLLPFCQQNNILLTAYSPLERGAIRPGFNETLDVLAKKYSKATAQIALNYLIYHDNVIVIPKSSNKEHIKENSESCGWRLEKSDLELLKSFT